MCLQSFLRSILHESRVDIVPKTRVNNRSSSFAASSVSNFSELQPPKEWMSVHLASKTVSLAQVTAKLQSFQALALDQVKGGDTASLTASTAANPS